MRKNTPQAYFLCKHMKEIKGLASHSKRSLPSGHNGPSIQMPTNQPRNRAGNTRASCLPSRNDQPRHCHRDCQSAGESDSNRPSDPNPSAHVTDLAESELDGAEAEREGVRVSHRHLTPTRPFQPRNAHGFCPHKKLIVAETFHYSLFIEPRRLAMVLLNT